MKRREIKVYTGIAGTEGLESFFEDKTDGNLLHRMLFRCQVNSQRELLVYRVFVEPSTIIAVTRYLDSNKPKEALLLLKKYALSVEIASENADEVWARIPSFRHDEIIPKSFENTKQLDLELEE